jgi:hypothetical protein
VQSWWGPRLLWSWLLWGLPLPLLQLLQPVGLALLGRRRQLQPRWCCKLQLTRWGSRAVLLLLLLAVQGLPAGTAPA